VEGWLEIRLAIEELSPARLIKHHGGGDDDDKPAAPAPPTLSMGGDKRGRVGALAPS